VPSGDPDYHLGLLTVGALRRQRFAVDDRNLGRECDLPGEATVANPSTVTGRRAHRISPIAILLVAAFAVGVFGAGLISSLLTAASSEALTWQLSGGIGGPRFDPAAAQSTTVVYVEVWWPGCVKTQDYSWLTPSVSYALSSVTITLRTNDVYANNPGCAKPRAGQLPNVGTYLSALSFPVQLSEPLAGRTLFDGSESPAAARPYRQP
jgi:hypothetical protein